MKETLLQQEIDALYDTMELMLDHDHLLQAIGVRKEIKLKELELQELQRENSETPWWHMS